MLYFRINNKPKIFRSMLVGVIVGAVQDTFAGEPGEGEGGEEEATGSYFYWYFYWNFYAQAERLPFLSP